jgi:hypothetical protein
MGDGEQTKDQAGMGIIDTRNMNDCLLVKWVYMENCQRLRGNLVQTTQSKIHAGSQFFQIQEPRGSQFWHGLHKVKQLFRWGAVYKIKKRGHDQVLGGCMDGKHSSEVAIS